MIRWTCPSCGHPSEMDINSAGTPVACPNCKALVRVARLLPDERQDEPLPLYTPKKSGIPLAGLTALLGLGVGLLFGGVGGCAIGRYALGPKSGAAPVELGVKGAETPVAKRVYLDDFSK